MVQITQKQLDALYTVYQRWQNITPHPIMPERFEIVSEEEYGTSYYGIWVGTPIDGKLGQMMLGIEADGYTHS